MAVAKLSLKSGVTPARAVGAFRPLLIEATNIMSGAGRAGDLRDRYLQWADAVESQLHGVSADPQILQMLHTPRYWRIRELTENSARPWDLVRSEVDVQVAAITRLLDDLERRSEALRSGPGQVVVLDTNILLHCLAPAQIPWDQLIGRARVRLVVPLRVVEELDAKEYSRRRDLAGRARRALAQLEETVGEGGQPRTLRSDVTIEVPVESVPRLRPDDADEEVLLLCGEIEQFSGGRAILVTGDTSMRLRARALGIEALAMPAEYLRPTTEPRNRSRDSVA